MDASNTLKSIRGKKLKTQEDVANGISVSRQVYNLYENNPLKCDLDTIFKIFEFLDATDEEERRFFAAMIQDRKSYRNDNTQSEKEKEE